MRPALRLLVVATVGLVAGALPARAANDPGWDRQWNMRIVGAETAWKTGIGADVTLAIVDTGVHATHEDLAGRVVQGRNFVTPGMSAQDDNGHGTHVAGIAAAAADNRVGIAGVAPGVRIMPVRVLGTDGSGTTEDIEAGIRWAADNGAHVVNLSLGDDLKLRPLGPRFADAIEYAWQKGAIVVLAAGNSGSRNIELLGHHAIVVTATDPEDEKPTWASNVGNALYGLAAPGGTGEPADEDDIISSYRTPDGRNDAYAWAAGTSMAAPHVSAAAAILRGLGLSRDQAVQRLLQTAKDLGSAGPDNVYGSGRLDVARAVSGLTPSPTTLTATNSRSTSTTRAGGAPPGGGTVVTPTTKRTTTTARAAATGPTTSTVGGEEARTAEPADSSPDGVRIDELGDREGASASDDSGSRGSGGDDGSPVWLLGVPAAAVLTIVARAIRARMRKAATIARRA